MRTIEDTYAATKAKGPRHGFSPYFVTDIIINELPGMVSIRTGATGPNISHVSACSTGAHSIGEAFRTIRHGYADGMIAGGAEATISILGVGGFNAMRAMSTRNDAPEKASRPFDKDRDGFVIGEGAGIVVLEELEAAKPLPHLVAPPKERGEGRGARARPRSRTSRSPARSGRSSLAVLPEKHRQFLEDVDPILTELERDTFLKLSTEYQRERFIEAFLEAPLPGARTACASPSRTSTSSGSAR